MVAPNLEVLTDVRYTAAKDDRGGSMASDEEFLLAKEKVEKLKSIVTDVQSRLGNMNMTDEHGRRLSPNQWNQRRQDLKTEHAEALKNLRLAKDELRKISSNSVERDMFRKKLIVEAYQCIVALEDKGIDIGERARELLDDIEFHWPQSQLQERRGSDSNE